MNDLKKETAEYAATELQKYKNKDKRFQDRIEDLYFRRCIKRLPRAIKKSAKNNGKNVTICHDYDSGFLYLIGSLTHLFSFGKSFWSHYLLWDNTKRFCNLEVSKNVKERLESIFGSDTLQFISSKQIYVQIKA